MAFIAKVAMAVSTLLTTHSVIFTLWKFPRGTHQIMKIYSWKTRASCGQPTSGLHFQFEFHITVLRYMGRVSVKQFVTNCNIKNMRFFLCTVYIRKKYISSITPRLTLLTKTFIQTCNHSYTVHFCKSIDTILFTSLETFPSTSLTLSFSSWTLSS